MAERAAIRLGETPIGRIGLGTNRLTPTSENIAFIREAISAGVGLIDTAHLYTDGESEMTIGAALGADHEGCLVATKGGYRPGEGRPEVLSAQIEQSLRSLATDMIDLYYLHKVNPDTPLEESLGTISEYRDRGAIRHVGVSNVTVEQIERARRVVPISAVQNKYNLTDHTHDDVVDHCAENGIVCVPYFPLQTDGSQAAEIAERRGATPAQIALAWLLRRSPTTLPIPGTLSLEHLKENLAAVELELTEEEFGALAGARPSGP